MVMPLYEIINDNNDEPYEIPLSYVISFTAIMFVQNFLIT